MKKSSKTPRGIANGSISKLYRPTAPPMIARKKLHRLTNKARGAASIPFGSCAFNKTSRNDLLVIRSFQHQYNTFQSTLFREKEEKI